MLSRTIGQGKFIKLMRIEIFFDLMDFLLRFSVESVGPKKTLICYKCQSDRVERKEAIIELVQTEVNYGNDFKIIKEVKYINLVHEQSILTVNNSYQLTSDDYSSINPTLTVELLSY